MDDTLCTLVGFFSSQFDSVLKFLEFEWPTQVLFYIYRILDHF